MKQIVFNVATGETTVVDVPDIENDETPKIPTVEERLTALEDVVTDMLFASL